MKKQSYKTFEIEDGSEDKKYFTIIPNFILNHSTAIDQALYLQLKRIAGENQKIVYASERFLMDKLGIGRWAFKKSMKYLLEHKWVEFAGYRFAETVGGKQQIKTYIVKDIWKLNSDFYNKNKGVLKTADPNQGVLIQPQRGAKNDPKGVLKTATKNNVVRITNNTDDFLKKDDARVRGACQ